MDTQHKELLIKMRKRLTDDDINKLTRLANENGQTLDELIIYIYLN